MGACHSTTFETLGTFVAPVTSQNTFFSPSELRTAAFKALRGVLRSRAYYAGQTDWPVDPTPDPEDTGVVVLDIGLGNTCEMRFYGLKVVEPDAPPANLGAFCRIWGLPQMATNNEGSCETLGLWLADLVITFGTTEVYDSAVIASDGKGPNSSWGKQIDVKHDRTLFPGIRHIGMGDFEEEAVPSIVFDTSAFAGLVVQMVQSAGAPSEPEPATNFGFMYRVY